MPVIERIYNVPLRKEFQKAPRYKRAKKAVNALKNFLKRHMKSGDIKIGRHLNLKIWEHGIKNPPHHVKINAVKDDEGIVKAELFGFKYEEAKENEKAEKKKEKEGEKQIKEELSKLKKKTKQLKETEDKKEAKGKKGKKVMKKKLERELNEKK